MKKPSPEFSFKLGQLIGTLQDFILNVQALTGDKMKADIDRVLCLTKDVQKKFYEMNANEES